MRLVMVNNTNKPIIFSRFAIDAREMVVVEQKLILSDVKVKNSQRSRSISLFVLSAPSIAGRLNKARLITISELDPARRFRKAVNSEKEVAEPVKTDPEPEKEVAEPVKATKTAGAHPNSKKPAQATADASNKPKRVRSNSGKKAPQEIPGL